MQRGYSEVYYFRGGIPEWRSFKYPLVADQQLLKIKVPKISAKTLKQYLEEDDIFHLDVRPNPYKKYPKFIKGATRCSMLDLAQNYIYLPKDKKIALCGPAMKQSPIAGKFLIQKGYQVLGALKGGTMHWERKGNPVVAEDEIPYLGAE